MINSTRNQISRTFLLLSALITVFFSNLALSQTNQFTDESRSSSAPHTQISSAADQFNFIFISGYGNEKIPGYFDENLNELAARGVSQASKIMPPTSRAVRDNIEMIRSELLRRFVEGGRRPLIVVAHSKGGLEMLNTILRHASDFPPSVIAQIYLVQSPLKGAPFADKVMARFDMSPLALNPLYWVNRALKYGGFTSLTTIEVLADLNFSAAFATSSDIKSISDRVHYFRSRKPESEISESLKEFAKDIREYGDNDGVVPTANEKLESFAGLEQFGTDLGVFDGIDHLDIVATGKDPKPERLALIRRFTDKLMQQVVATLRPAHKTLRSELLLNEKSRAVQCESLF